VGSDADLSVAELAQHVSNVVRPEIPVRIAATPPTEAPPSRYVPSVSRAAHELGLSTRIVLDEAIRRTADWYLPVTNA
jgi:nucleoside-diphosphate-sugar epimerase